MNEVPAEVIQIIVLFIPTQNYVSLMLVNPTWNSMFEENSSLWKYLCERDFAQCSISAEYKEEYVSCYTQRFVVFPEQQHVVMLSENYKRATISNNQYIVSVFLNKQIHVTGATSSIHQYRFRSNSVSGAGYFIGFFIDRSATIPTAKTVSSLYREYIGYRQGIISYGFNDHGYIFNQGLGNKVPNLDINDMFFVSHSEILLTLKISGEKLDTSCKVGKIEAHIRDIPLVKGDVIYVGATLYRDGDSISVLPRS